MKVISMISMILLLVILPATVSAKGKKTPPLSITFHLEAGNSTGKKLSIPIQTRLGKKFIQKSPSLSTQDFIAYNTFVSPHDNEGFGVSLQLSKVAAQRLRYLSVQNKGKYLIANINGKTVDMLYIDKQVDGRVITIWRGVDPRFFSIVNPILPKIGETKDAWKKRLKSEQKLRKK